jgi:hypothetical protein
MEEHDMAEGGRREEVDARIARWERDLERLRVALANATDTVNAKHHPTFVELYRRKEVAKSRWEEIRGVYRPDAHAVRRCEDALAAMEAAWQQAQATLTEVVARQSA